MRGLSAPPVTLPFYEFHVLAKVYGWSWQEYQETPQKVLDALPLYIDADNAAERHALAN